MIKGETAQFASRGRGGRYKGQKGNSGSKARDSEDDRKEEYLKKAGGVLDLRRYTL
jgi:hypothetical protein